MEAKAAFLKKTIRYSAISEPGFQLADWLVPGITDLLDMLYYWNSQVFDDLTGVNLADFTNAHFYSYRNFMENGATVKINDKKVTVFLKKLNYHG